MSEHATSSRSGPRKFWTFWTILIASILGFLFILIVVYWLLVYAARRGIENQVERIRSKGEPTSVSELAREPIPDERNVCAGVRDAIAFMEARQLPRPPSWRKGSKSPRPGPTLWHLSYEFVEFAAEGSSTLEVDRARVVVERHRKALDSIAEAVARPEHVPLVDYTSARTLEPTNLVNGGNMTALLGTQAILQALDGNGDAATESLLCAIRHAMAAQDHPTFADKVFTLNFLHASLNAVEGVARNGKLSADNRARLIETLSSLDLVTQYREGLIEERAMLFEIWSQPDPSHVEHVVPLMYYQDIHQLIAFDNWWIETTAGDPWDAYAALRSRRSSVDGMMRWRYPIAVGLMLTFERSHVSLCYTVAQRDVTVVGLACQRYESRHGAFPARLADLVPDILTAVPVDPFTGKELAYRLTPGAFIVYSVGENLTDDAGRGPYAGADDIAWPRVKRPPPRPRPRPPAPSKRRIH